MSRMRESTAMQVVYLDVHRAVRAAVAPLEKRLRPLERRLGIATRKRPRRRRA